MVRYLVATLHVDFAARRCLSVCLSGRFQCPTAESDRAKVMSNDHCTMAQTSSTGCEQDNTGGNYTLSYTGRCILVVYTYNTKPKVEGKETGIDTEQRNVLCCTRIL